MTKKLINSIKESYLSSEFVLAVDSVLALASSILALWGVKILTDAPFSTPRQLSLYLITAIIASVAFLFATKANKIIIRHFSVKDIIPFAIVSIGKSLAILAVLFIAGLLSKYFLLIVFLYLNL